MRKLQAFVSSLLLVTFPATFMYPQSVPLFGHVLGKDGGNFILPGALAKLASKSVKAAKELVAVCKQAQMAQELLVLETVAEIGNTARIAEIVETGQRMARLTDELGFTTQEIGHLKQAERLEKVTNVFEDILQDQVLKESYILFEKAETFLTPYRKKFMTESQIRDLIH